MSLSRKFLLFIISSIFLLALINIASFYLFYNVYIKIYLAEKIQYKDEVTIDYINQIIEKQTVDDIDRIFSDAEIEFFDLLESSKGKIPLNEEKNRDIIINYLIKSWVTPKYIEEILPTNSFQKVLESLKDTKTPEYNFLQKLIWTIAIINLFALLIVIILIYIFTRKTIFPIKDVTRQIQSFDFNKSNKAIEYDKKDEIGLLIHAINELNKGLSVQEWIRTRLIADISHELKTPITSIQCYLEWISDGVIQLDKKTLTSITSEMKRLVTLVNAIMDFQKFENKALNLSLTLENISDILKEVVITHKNKLKENNQKIKISWDEKIEKELDRDIFKQLVHNLIGNFLKYAGSNTQLIISINKNYLDFSDNGVWIKQNEVPFLTEKFYQGKSEKTWDIEERGIWVGLSIVDKIIVSHNWRYQIKSDEWKGFNFRIIW